MAKRQGRKRRRGPKESPRSEQVAAVARLLKRTIAGAGFSQKEVERKLGWGDGYLSQILRGRVGFKFAHCFAVLGAIGVPVRDFFAQLGAPEAGPEAAKAPDNPVDKRDENAGLRRNVEQWIEEILARKGKGEP